MSSDAIAKNVATLDTLGITGVDDSLFDTSVLDEVYAGSNTIK
jgi:hypothetical protein